MLKDRYNLIIEQTSNFYFFDFSYVSFKLWSIGFLGIDISLFTTSKKSYESGHLGHSICEKILGGSYTI